MSARVDKAPKEDIKQLCESLREAGFTKSALINDKKNFLPVFDMVIKEYYKSINSVPEKAVIKEIIRNL